MVDMSKITKWIIDEAYQSMPSGYSCKIGTDQDILDRTRIQQYRNRRYAYNVMMSKSIFRFLHKFKFYRNYVETFIYNKCDQNGKIFYDDLMGECMYKEADNEDLILMFPDRIQDISK